MLHDDRNPPNDRNDVRYWCGIKNAHASEIARLTDPAFMSRQLDVPSETLSDDDVAAIDALRTAYGTLKAEIGRVIVGQIDAIEQLAICFFARRHALLVGVPGLAKTLLVSKFAETLSLSFSRIQFTPDLMPMDITGTDILQDNAEGRREFQFVRGPVFANVVLADEINRAPPKTQAALLEAMQESNVTVLGKEFALPSPFMVLATQNPVEQEGTYPLPEAQLDRFMALIELGYPSEAEEIEIARLTTGTSQPVLQSLLDISQILDHQDLVRRVPVPDHLYEFAAKLVRQTRPTGGTAPDWLIPLVGWGAGPRAVQSLILGAKSRAALYGSYMVRREDIVAVAPSVLAHRLVLTFAAQAERISAREIVTRLVESN
ncbi:AAA family ATPase [Roseiconus lacunae]|nr:AAA family ATPase [Roseiconus lacunae]